VRVEPDVVKQHRQGGDHQQQAQHLGHPDGLPGDGPVEQIQAVGAQTLDPEAAHTVPQEVEAGVLAVEPPGLGYHKNDQQQADDVPQALIQEGGVDLHQFPSSGGQLHAPGQGGLGAEGLPVQEIAPAADGLADEQAHDHQVHHGPKLDVAAAAENDGHDHHGDDAAVNGQAAVPDGDGLGPAEMALMVLELTEIEQNIVQPGPHDGRGDAPQQPVDEVILPDAVFGALAHTPPQGYQHAQGDEDAVPIDAVADVDGLGADGDGPVAKKPREADGAVGHDLHNVTPCSENSLYYTAERGR